MEPLTMALLLGAGGAAANIWGNNQARKASNKAADRERAIRDEAYGILQGINPDDLQNIDNSYLDNIINPYSQSANYSPEMLQYIAENDPLAFQDLGDARSTLVGDSPEARNYQWQALQNLRTRAEEGLDMQSQADFIKAQRDAGEMARGREAAISQNMQARGMGGSNMEAMLRMMASQGSANQLADSSAQRAATNARERALAEQMAMQGASGLRASDIALAAQNANILNEFSLNNSARRQQIANMNIQQQNEAARRNIEEQRNIMSGNVGTMNDAQLKNLEIDRLRRDYENRARVARGEAANEKTKLLYGAKTDQLKGLSSAKLGYAPAEWTRGAAEADYNRNLWGSIGSVPTAAASYYMKKGLKTATKETKEKDDELEVKPMKGEDPFIYRGLS